MTLRNALGEPAGIAFCLIEMANIAHAYRLARRAARLSGAADALLDAIGHVMRPTERAAVERTLGALRARLGEAAFAAAREEGREMSVEAAVTAALATEHEATRSEPA